MKNLLIIILSLLVINVTNAQVNPTKQRVELSPRTVKKASQSKKEMELTFSEPELDKIKQLTLEEFQLIKELAGPKPQYLRAYVCENIGSRTCVTLHIKNMTCKKLKWEMDNNNLYPGYEIDECTNTSNGIDVTLARQPSAIDTKGTETKY